MLLWFQVPFKAYKNVWTKSGLPDFSCQQCLLSVVPMLLIYLLVLHAWCRPQADELFSHPGQDDADAQGVLLEVLKWNQNKTGLFKPNLVNFLGQLFKSNNWQIYLWVNSQSTKCFAFQKQMSMQEKIQMDMFVTGLSVNKNIFQIKMSK